MTDPLDQLDDAHGATAFRRLVRHLRHRADAQNIDLMGLAGFCRNCLADWLVEAGAPLDKAAARAERTDRERDPIIRAYANEWMADIMISLYDVWTMKRELWPERVASWVPIDHQPALPTVAQLELRPGTPTALGSGSRMEVP